MVAISDPDGSGLYNKVLAHDSLSNMTYIYRSNMGFSLIAKKAKELRDDIK